LRILFGHVSPLKRPLKVRCSSKHMDAFGKKRKRSKNKKLVGRRRGGKGEAPKKEGEVLIQLKAKGQTPNGAEKQKIKGRVKKEPSVFVNLNCLITGRNT